MYTFLILYYQLLPGTNKTKISSNEVISLTDYKESDFNENEEGGKSNHLFFIFKEKEEDDEDHYGAGGQRV